MMNASYSETTIAELVRQQPARAHVFERAGIDYCCGGKQILCVVCRRKRISLNHLCQELATCDSTAGKTPGETIDWRNRSLEDLIDNIVNTHHAYLRAEFPLLKKLMDKVLLAHGAKHPELAELRRVLLALETEIFAHMHKEEQILFPRIKNLKHANSLKHRQDLIIDSPIEVMEAEHLNVREALSRLHWLTGGYHPPADSCSSYRLLMSSLKNLETDLHFHIHKENNLLFPKASKLAASLLIEA